VTRTVDDVKREAHLVVQKCLRRKIQETMDLRSLAEKRITETDLVCRCRLPFTALPAPPCKGAMRCA
jgi:hypothetical protein